MSKASTAGDFVILCVCAGNIHRSVLAEALLETWAQWYLPADAVAHVRVDSAGLIAEPGVPMGGQARRIAVALGVEDRARTATTLTDDLVAGADLVLTATRRQAEEVVRRVPAALRSTFTMREAGRIAAGLDVHPTAAAERTPGALRTVVSQFADRRSSGPPDEDDVIDPQGRGDEAYLQMTRQEVPALATVAVALFGMSEADLGAYLRAANDPAALLQRAADEPGGKAE